MDLTLHLLLHAALPGAAAGLLFRGRWRRGWVVMLAANLVDLDHLLASPVYDPTRCSIGFHPLHSYAAIAAYVLLAAVRRTRVAGVGLLLHMVVDAVDCAFMQPD